VSAEGGDCSDESKQSTLGKRLAAARLEDTVSVRLMGARAISLRYHELLRSETLRSLQMRWLRLPNELCSSQRKVVYRRL
jgi:hypothetical protein